MHLHPAKSWRSLERYYNARKVELSPEELAGKLFPARAWKKLRRRIRHLLKHNQSIYSTLVGRMPPEGLHLGEGMEMSHGAQFYCLILHRYGHSHATCLAKLLKIIANLKLLKPDPATSATETVMDYFDRGLRSSREASQFPGNECSDRRTIAQGVAT
jgi:hypothetical protein